MYNNLSNLKQRRKLEVIGFTYLRDDNEFYKRIKVDGGNRIYLNIYIYENRGKLNVSFIKNGFDRSQNDLVFELENYWRDQLNMILEI